MKVNKEKRYLKNDVSFKKELKYEEVIENKTIYNIINFLLNNPSKLNEYQ